MTLAPPTDENELLMPIVGTDERYFVTTLGRIYNAKTKRWLKPFNHDARGWQSVNIIINGKRDNYKVHRLVAKAFLANPDNKPAINHIDADRTNNRVTNLEWCTDTENNDHRLRSAKPVTQKRRIAWVWDTPKRAFAALPLLLATIAIAGVL